MKAKEMYKKYKEVVEEFFSKSKGATTATNDDDDAGNTASKIDKIWTDLNANGHSLLEITGFLREICSLQNSGCKQNRSVCNKNVRLFCCGSMLDKDRKFAPNTEALCPFFMYCKVSDNSNEWNVVVKDQVGVNCPYHIPSCNSKSRNVPVKFLKAQMGGVITHTELQNLILKCSLECIYIRIIQVLQGLLLLLCGGL